MTDPATPETDGALPARRLLRAHTAAVLCTHSTRFPGYPAGSSVAVSTDPGGAPVLLVSALAAHTRNLDADFRVSLALHEGDPASGPRLSLTGDVETLPPDHPGALRHLARFPAARQWAGFGDFRFVRIHPVGVHYIGGFGDIRWFDGAQFLLPDLALDAQADDIVAHMNEDHRAALADMARQRLGATPAEVEMVAVDGDGFDALADGRLLRVDFAATATDAEAARMELVRLVRAARAAAA